MLVKLELARLEPIVTTSYVTILQSFNNTKTL